MFKRGLAVVAIAAATVGVSVRSASAAAYYTDDFNSAADASNYNVNQVKTSGGAAASDATFGYDYSALGIPSAPNTSDGTTRGLRLRVENLGSAASGVGTIQAVTKGLSLPSAYTVTVDVWGNYIGGTSIAASGSNGTNAAGIGVGTVGGTTLQSPNANDGFIADAFHDGGGGPDYRIYSGGTRLDSATTPYFAAGETASAGLHSDPYYTFLTSHTAPAAEVTLSPSTQGGSSPVGIIGFAWHTMTINQDGTNLTWAIDGHTITTVPDSAITFHGSQVSLLSIDSSTGGNTNATAQLLNTDIFDNLVITPEPASLGLLAMAAIPLFRRRRTR